MTAILKVCIRHRVRFAPDPKNTAWPTQPQFVDRRLVKDVEEFPVGVKYLIFDDVVESTVRLPNGEVKVLVSEPVNKETFHVEWDRDKVNRILANHQNWPSPIDVHSSLVGEVWVIASLRGQAEAQKALAA